MLDRLNELRRIGPQVLPLQPGISDNTLLPVEQGYTNREQGIEESYFQKIKSTKAYMQKIRSNIERMQALRQLFYKAIKSSQQKEATDQLEELNKQNNFLHQKLKQLLQIMKQEVDDSQKNPDLVNEPQTKMKKNFYNTTTNEVMKILKEQSLADDAFKTSMRQKLGRQVKIINRNLSDQQVQDYVNNPQKAQMMLQQKIYGQASHNLRNAVSDIQDKFKDIQKLQQCVSQCLQLFKQLSAMVFAQGQMIDNIQQNCVQAKDYIQKADKQLIKAKQHHQCSRKCMCILIVIGIIVLLVVLIPIIVTFTKK